MSADAQRYMSLGEAAELLHVTERAIRYWIARGTLPASRIKGSKLIRLERTAVEAMLQPIPAVGPDDAA